MPYRLPKNDTTRAGREPERVEAEAFRELPRGLVENRLQSFLKKQSGPLHV